MAVAADLAIDATVVLVGGAGTNLYTKVYVPMDIDMCGLSRRVRPRRFALTRFHTRQRLYARRQRQRRYGARFGAEDPVRRHHPDRRRLRRCEPCRRMRTEPRPRMAHDRRSPRFGREVMVLRSRRWPIRSSAQCQVCLRRGRSDSPTGRPPIVGLQELTARSTEGSASPETPSALLLSPGGSSGLGRRPMRDPGAAEPERLRRTG